MDNFASEMETDATTTLPPGQPRHNLYMEVDRDTLRAMKCPVYGDGAPSLQTMRLERTEAGRTEAMEAALYSCPGLLEDFNKSRIFVRTLAYTCIPAGAPEAFAADACRGLCICGDDDTVVTDSASGPEAIAWAITAREMDFLRRTFPGATVQSHISPMLAYFRGRLNMGNHGKTFAHIWSGADPHVDIFVFDHAGQLAMLTSKPADTDQDAIYYILACTIAAGNDPREDEILLCGDRGRRLEMMHGLRRYATNVMPVLLPGAVFRGGAHPDAPFCLMVNTEI